MQRERTRCCGKGRGEKEKCCRSIGLKGGVLVREDYVGKSIYGQGKVVYGEVAAPFEAEACRAT